MSGGKAGGEVAVAATAAVTAGEAVIDSVSGKTVDSTRLGSRDVGGEVVDGTDSASGVGDNAASV
jgi:hypothetical protein